MSRLTPPLQAAVAVLVWLASIGGALLLHMRHHLP